MSLLSSLVSMFKKKEKEENLPFWRTKKLEEMTEEEWESLCDGCGKCCLHKVDHWFFRNKVIFTGVSCKLLDTETCLCKDYENRKEKIPECVKISIETFSERPRWWPKTCAYWLVYKGKDLPEWHPLKTGNKNSVHEAGKSVKGRVISEDDVVRYSDHIIKWYDR